MKSFLRTRRFVTAFLWAVIVAVSCSVVAFSAPAPAAPGNPKAPVAKQKPTTVSGTVIVGDDKTNTVCGARVGVGDDFGNFVGAPATSGPHGEFKIDNLASGPNVIVAKYPRYQQAAFRVTIGSQAPSPLTMKLGTGSISGTVVATNGNALKGATVRLDWASPQLHTFRSISLICQAPKTPSPIPTPTTDDNGKFTIKALIAGDYVLKIVHPDVSPTPVALFLQQAVDQLSQAITVQLPEITGTIRDLNGLPVPGASVIRCEFTSPAVLGSAPTPCPTSSPAMNGDAWQMVPSNSVGQYTFEHVGANTKYRITVLKPAYGNSLSNSAPDPASTGEGALPMPAPPSSPAPTTNDFWASAAPSQIARHTDLWVSPPIDVLVGEGDASFVIGFNNRTDRNATVVFWAYNCHNVAQCNLKNTSSSPADSQSMHSFLLKPHENGKTYTYVRAFPHQPDSDFSAAISYCYFASAKLANSPAAGGFDVVSWAPSPSPQASAPPADCRTVLATQPVGF